METRLAVDQQYLQLMQQLVLQKDNIALRKEAFRGQSNKSQTPTGPDSNDSDWPIFIDIGNRDKGMRELTDPAVIRNELRKTYTRELNRLLFNLVGDETLNSAAEGHRLRSIILVWYTGKNSTPYYPAPEAVPEKFDMSNDLTGPELQHQQAREWATPVGANPHAEPRRTGYQNEPPGTEPDIMEVEDVDGPERIEIHTMMEVDEDQYQINQPTMNQGQPCSTRCDLIFSFF